MAKDAVAQAIQDTFGGTEAYGGNVTSCHSGKRISMLPAGMPSRRLRLLLLLRGTSLWINRRAAICARLLLWQHTGILWAGWSS